MVCDTGYPVNERVINNHATALHDKRKDTEALTAQAIARRAIDVVREAKQSDVEISMQWNEGDRIPRGFIKCRPGPHIRRIAANDDTDIGPFLEGNETAMYSIGNPVPTIIIGPPDHSSEHEPVLNLLVTRAKPRNPTSC
jgi:hypothetical protein